MDQNFLEFVATKPIIQDIEFDQCTFSMHFADDRSLVIECENGCDESVDAVLKVRMCDRGSSRVAVGGDWGQAPIPMEFESGTYVWQPREFISDVIGRALVKIFSNPPMLFLYVDKLAPLRCTVLRDRDTNKLVLYWVDMS